MDCKEENTKSMDRRSVLSLVGLGIIGLSGAPDSMGSNIVQKDVKVSVVSDSRAVKREKR